MPPGLCADFLVPAPSSLSALYGRVGMRTRLCGELEVFSRFQSGSHQALLMAVPMGGTEACDSVTLGGKFATALQRVTWAAKIGDYEE